MRWAFVVLAACGGGGHDTPDASTIDADSCAHIPGAVTTVGTIDNISSSELSGLAISRTVDNVLWSHGDAGGKNEVYAIDAANAQALGTLKVTGGTNVDWEDIATAPCTAGHCIYVSDTGDNDLVRTSVSIYEIIEPASAPVGTIAVDAIKYDIVYPDGPHNVEALFVDPRDGKSYGIVKNTGHAAAVFELPRTSGTATAEQVGSLTIPASDPRVTAADFAVDSCSTRILIRTYGKLYELRGTATASVPELLGAALATMPVADEPQGEAVAYSADGHAYYTTSEGDSPKLSRVSD